MVRERRAEHEEAVGLGDGLAGDGDPGPAEDAAAERVVVGEGALGLERGDDRRVEVLGEGHHGVAVGAGAVAHHDGGTLGGPEQLDGAGQLVGRWGDAGGGHPARPWPWRRIVEAGQLLHVVGQHEVGDVALHDGVLHGEGGELGGVGRRQDRLAPLGHGIEGLLERQLLEGARPDDLGLHLPGEREHRDAVDLGVPQAGEQVGGPGAGDGEAGGRAAGELGVARMRRRRRRPRGGCRRR